MAFLLRIVALALAVELGGAWLTVSTGLHICVGVVGSYTEVVGSDTEKVTELDVGISQYPPTVAVDARVGVIHPYDDLGNTCGSQVGGAGNLGMAAGTTAFKCGADRAAHEFCTLTAQLADVFASSLTGTQRSSSMQKIGKFPNN